ncbi:hypothetical protein UPYG_G00055380 [Umbra pygmaea]|uniref:Uncharacterized protein n=1 Tax=Umbra pygmaea TaxID=75934 RepID=A0ABD0X838_UMBPY
MSGATGESGLSLVLDVKEKEEEGFPGFAKRPDNCSEMITSTSGEPKQHLSGSGYQSERRGGRSRFC